MRIPIIVICYNNYRYVKNTLSQILKINREYYNNIMILNNKSTCLHTINFLNGVDVPVINNSTNNGPWITKYKNPHIYNRLPNKFIITDPDLKFNENIPNNFIEILSNLSDTYKVSNVGFALDLSHFDKMYKDIYCNNKTIYDHEIQFWKNKLIHKDYQLYQAPIDTTFCLVNKIYLDDNKEGLSNRSIRIAGNFLAKHLPWYIENEVYNVYDNYICNTNTSAISTTSRIITSYIERNYVKVNKNDEFFFIENNEDNKNLHFWKNIYTMWESSTFKIVDTYLSHDKIFIDIGGWIGTTAMYASRKSKHVYSIERDNESFNEMAMNLKTNCVENYTLINNNDNFKIMIDIENSTITLENTIHYKINTFEISLIKVDIKGKEEDILNDLFNIHINFKIPIYIKIYYSMWGNSDLDRFTFLSDTIKNKIKSIPDSFLVLS